MGSLYLVLCGLGGGYLVYWLSKKTTKWYHWVLAILLYVWICLGISFVYINSIGYHHQAVQVGSIFFGITSLAGAFGVARMMGFSSKKKAAQ